MRLYVFVTLSLLVAGTALAAPGYDAECRPLPMLGFMMAPQPPSADCLRQQAEERRAADAAERQRKIQAAAEAKIEHDRIEAQQKQEREHAAIEQMKCSAATPADVQSTIEQDPEVFGRRFTVLDVTQPRYNGSVCQAQAMTSVIKFEEFNGNRYIRVRFFPHVGN